MSNTSVLFDDATAEGEPSGTGGKLEVKFLERRKSSRFPVKEDLQYRLIHRENKTAGYGRTVDLSSSGILFWAHQEIPLGCVLQVSVNWPARLDGTCPLKLVVEGPVVRVDGHRVAVRIARHEFRTRGTRTTQLSAVPC